MKEGGNRLPLVLVALAVLVLVGVVAVASTGTTPSGTSDKRPPADLLLDTFFSLGLLALVPAAALLVYGLMQRKEIAREMASGRYRRTSLAAYLVFALLFTAAVYFRLTDFRFNLGGPAGDVVDIGDNPPAGTPDRPDPNVRLYEPEFAWIPILLVCGVAALGVFAYVISARRRARALGPGEEALANRVADVLEETLDDLRAEPDARRAVIAAYARLEHSLAASGLPRKRQETAEEYVTRILGRLEVDARPVRKLTDLFTWAKFSHHDVDETMKLEAIAALEEIRDDLRQAVRRAAERALEPGGDERAAAL
jgi:hypothetical protein